MTQRAELELPALRADISDAEPLVEGMAPSSSSAEVVLKARGLSKHYGSHAAVEDVSFDVYAGEVFGFLGPNGAGKSTTIAMVLGLIAPTAGTIDLLGMGPSHRAEALSRVGAIIETPSFYPYLSGFDNLSVMGALRGGISAERIRSALEMAGLTDAARRRFSSYSLGMKQRLGIASTLMHNPSLIILDEPTNGLDPAGIIEVRQLIRKLADRGKTVFISSHLLQEIEQVCDRVAILQHGRVIAEGRVKDLVNNGVQVAVRTDQPERAASLLREIDGVERVEPRADDLLVSGPRLRPALVAATLVTAGIEVDELRHISSSLEEIFLRLTAEQQGGVPAHG